jgi:hypothetical protein
MAPREEPKPRWVHNDGVPYDDLDRRHTRWVDDADLERERLRPRLRERVARRLFSRRERDVGEA